MYPTKDILKEHLCTYSKNKDTCQGDSRGPLTVMDHDRFTVIGVSAGKKVVQTNMLVCMPELLRL